MPFSKSPVSDKILHWRYLAQIMEIFQAPVQTGNLTGMRQEIYFLKLSKANLNVK